MIDANTSLIALLGNPIGHSLSRACIWPRSPTWGPHLLSCFLRTIRFESALRIGGARAIGATLPYRSRSACLGRSPDISAEATGAVNTIVFAESVGYNTDVVGIKEALNSLGCTSGSALLWRGRRSRAVLHVLADSGFLRYGLPIEAKIAFRNS